MRLANTMFIDSPRRNIVPPNTYIQTATTSRSADKNVRGTRDRVRTAARSAMLPVRSSRVSSHEAIGPSRAGIGGQEGAAAMTPDDFFALAKKHHAEMVDLKFIDMLGTWQHCSFPIDLWNADTFKEGLGF